MGTKLDALSGRKGEIAAAAGAIYRRVLARDPEFRDKIIAAGRDREISAAYRETALSCPSVPFGVDTHGLTQLPQCGFEQRW